MIPPKNEPVATPPVLWPDRRKGPWSITLTWLRLHGRQECVGVEVKSAPSSHLGDMDLAAAHLRGDALATPMSTSVWREIPISSIIDAERALTAAWVATLPGEPGEEWAGRGRRPRHSPSEVARIYTEAWQQGKRPTKAVAEALGISSSAAAKQVSRARALGHLPPTAKGKAQGGGS